MRLFFRFILIFFALLPFSIANSAGPPPPDTNAKIKCAYLLQFTKNIEWPGNYKEGAFVIGVLGNTSLLDELNKMAATKKVGLQNIEVKSFGSYQAISKCHLLYVAPDFTGNFKDVLGKLKGNSTLTVTEKSGLAKQGAAINFVIQENKLKFELNKGNAEKFNLSVGTSLLPLAILVE